MNEKMSKIRPVKKLGSSYDIVIVTAGIQHSKSMTKIEMLEQNYQILVNSLRSKSVV